MFSRKLFLYLPFLLLCTLSLGQGLPTSRGRETSVESVMVKVTVVDADSRPLKRVNVQLLSGLGNVINESVTIENGQVDFDTISSGNFRVRVYGTDIEDTTSPAFYIRPRQGFHSEYLQVKRKPEAQQGGPGGMVSLEDLNLPERARSEFEKGNAALGRGQAEEARAHFDLAIQIYPGYAAAYNNLGVCHMNAGHSDLGRQAFEKALAINPRFTGAYRNLAALVYSQGKFAEAEGLVAKSLETNPVDPEGLTLLAKIQLVGGKPKSAIETAHKIHSLPHLQYALAHYIAATAFDSLGQGREATAEYEVFLQEDPNSPIAAKARDALKRLAAKAN